MVILTEFLVSCNETWQRFEDLQDCMKSCFPNNQRMRSHKHVNKALNAQDQAMGTDTVSHPTLQLTF